MASFAQLAKGAKAMSFDERGGRDFEGFKPLRSSRRATFSGDTSVELLRRRLVGSNFASTKAAGEKSFEAPAARRQVFVVVDAFSTGACVAAEAALAGFAIMHVLSLEPSDALAAMVPAHLRGQLPWDAVLGVTDETMPLPEAAAALAAQLQKAVAGRELVAVVAGAETGVKLADLLSAHIANDGWAPLVRSNGAGGAEARRNKWDMGEKVRAAGVRAVRQLRACEWPPVEQWLRDEWAPLVDVDSPDLHFAVPMIVKPLESAGSDGVTACRSVADVREAVQTLVGKTNGLGLVNDGVLVQEFLQGDEFVVDGIQRNGERKVSGLWSYDRRPTNGAGFVLHGQFFMPSGGPADALVSYSYDVLAALELEHGPSHMEIKLTPGGPCLVEVGARCHGAEGFWMSIADACTGGHNQATACLASYLPRAEAFENLPQLPPQKLLKSGRIKYLLVHHAGTLVEISAAGLAIITSLASYTGHEIFVHVGDRVIPTVDCFSWGGIVKLVHAEESVVAADYAVIEKMCQSTTEFWVTK
ncbi:ATP-grasp domain-containing protein [Pelagophyceae sp. CCMP2097]|nr:ATP-grasp domain-containing protein [Pelagophyceae sp. CCMP2097]